MGSCISSLCNRLVQHLRICLIFTTIVSTSLSRKNIVQNFIMRVHIERFLCFSFMLWKFHHDHVYFNIVAMLTYLNNMYVCISHSYESSWPIHHSGGVPVILSLLDLHATYADLHRVAAVVLLRMLQESTYVGRDIATQEGVRILLKSLERGRSFISWINDWSWRFPGNCVLLHFCVVVFTFRFFKFILSIDYYPVCLLGKILEDNINWPLPKFIGKSKRCLWYRFAIPYWIHFEW